MTGIKRRLLKISNRLASAGFVLKHFEQIRHTLSAERKPTRGAFAGRMLQHLSSASD
jgi:hypothetical protein